jgi:hypothetical protein
MSVDAVMGRISQIVQMQQQLADPSAALSTSVATTSTAGAGATNYGSFGSALASAIGTQSPQASGLGSTAAPGAVLGAGGDPAQRMVQIAQGEVGQAEQPPGSNDSPRIAQYRAAVAGNPGPGPWCAYFTSWVAQQAGVPLGPGGQGFGSVDQLWSWAQQSGKAVPRGGQPQPGDLIVLPEHIGVVTAVLPGGQLQTVEGNYSNKVTANTRSVSEALGFVRPTA